MSDLIEKANKIIYLVDTHGEPSRCRVKNCETCTLIKELRDEIGKKGIRGQDGPITQKPRYVYICESDGITKRFYKLNDVIAFLESSRMTVVKYMKTKGKINGFTITRKLFELEETE